MKNSSTNQFQHAVTLQFYQSDIGEYEDFRRVKEQVDTIIIEQYRKGNKCPHKPDDPCVTTETYQQGAGLTIINQGANLTGGEIVQVCSQCSRVLKIVKEADATGAN